MGSKCFRINLPRPSPPALPTALDMASMLMSSRVSWAGSSESSSGEANVDFMDFQREERSMPSNWVAACWSLRRSGVLEMDESWEDFPIWDDVEAAFSAM